MNEEVHAARPMAPALSIRFDYARIGRGRMISDADLGSIDQRDLSYSMYAVGSRQEARNVKRQIRPGDRA